MRNSKKLASALNTCTPLPVLRITPFNAPLMSLLIISALHSLDTRADEAESTTSNSLSVHIDVVSKYVVRGLTTTYGNGKPLGNIASDAPESDKPTLQWGADYTAESGWYIGYWASQINFSYAQIGKSYEDRSITNLQKNKSIENDFYGGYNKKLGDLTYTLGLTGYVYINGEHSDALESKIGISYGRSSLYAQTLLSDVVWGNKGDTYITAIFMQPLPYSLSLNFNLGYYLYTQEGKYIGTYDTLLGVACSPGQAFIINGCYNGTEPGSNAFRHFIVSLGQPLGKTGLNWSLQYILPGENRFGIQQENQLVGSLSYIH